MVGGQDSPIIITAVCLSSHLFWALGVMPRPKTPFHPSLSDGPVYMSQGT